MRNNILIVIIAWVLVSCNSENKNKSGHTVTPPVDSLPVQTPEPAINPYAGVDVSPMDMSYYPVDYPKVKMGNALATPPLARIIYSRPHLQGRHVFKEVLKYGEPWRLGANEATELQLFSDAVIQGKKIKAGRYTMYCIPDTSQWVIAINSNTDNWGLRPDAGKDVARFVVPVNSIPLSLEYFTMVFQQKDAGAELLMAWDNVEVRLPFRF